MIQILTTSVV